MHLDYRTLSTVLCALRIYQEEISNFGWEAITERVHFIDVEPFTHAEIDTLCDQLNGRTTPVNEALPVNTVTLQELIKIAQAYRNLLKTYAHTEGEIATFHHIQEVLEKIQPVTPQPEESEDPIPEEPESDGATYLRCSGCGAFIIEGEWMAHTH